MYTVYIEYYNAPLMSAYRYATAALTLFLAVMIMWWWTDMIRHRFWLCKIESVQDQGLTRTPFYNQWRRKQIEREVVARPLKNLDKKKKKKKEKSFGYGYGYV